MSWMGRRSSIRLIVAVPPRLYFGGNDRQNALSIVAALRAVFPHIFLFDCDTYLSGSVGECAAQLAAARNFRPNVGLGLPNAGYGIILDQRPKDQESIEQPPRSRLSFFSSGQHSMPRGNVFADELNIPIVMPWDHLITQAPQYFLGYPPVQRHKSQTGCLAKLRNSLRHDNFVHYIPDSGHIETFERLGIVSPGSLRNYVVPAHDVFLGVPPVPTDKLVTDRILFAGNLSSGRVMAEFGDDPVVHEIRESVVATKYKDWSIPAWRIYEDIAARKHTSGIAELGPDHTFFWSLGRELTSHIIFTAFRTTVFESLQTPIDFYGGFTDPDFVTALAHSGLFRAMGSVPFESLGAIYARYQFSVDVTHTPFINGSNAKVLDCFASGGFMFVDWRKDLHAEIGELADEFMYRSAEELNTKIERLRGNPKRRLEIIKAMRERISCDLNFVAFFSKTIHAAKQALHR